MDADQKVLQLPLSRMSEDLTKLLAYLRRFETPARLEDCRTNYDSAAEAFPLASQYRVEPWDLPGVQGERVVPPSARPGRAILYVHGGGYVMGSPRSHRHLAGALGERAEASVYVLDYRRAPEHPFPAAFEDAEGAYRALAARADILQIALAGDSAGGGLAVACAAAMTTAANRPRPPVALTCVSPWTDLSLCDVAMDSQADPLMKLELNRSYAASYLGSADPRDPRASPVYADLSGMPPMQILVGSLEQIYRDSARLAAAARQQGVNVALDVTEGAPHVWPWFWPRSQAAAEGVERMGSFMHAAFERAMRMQ